MATATDKSNIFSRMHELVKTTAHTLSTALKQAWVEFKNGILSIPVMPGACAVVAETEEQIEEKLLNEVSFKRFTHRNDVLGIRSKYAVYNGYAMDEDERLFSLKEEDGKIYLNEDIRLRNGNRAIKKSAGYQLIALNN